MFYLLITLTVLFISYYLFSLSAGSMNIREVNMQSFIFYYHLILYSVIGSVIIVNGIDNSEWFRHIDISNQTRLNGWLTVLYTTIALPLGMLLATRLLKINNMKKYYREYRFLNVQPFLSKNDKFIFIGLSFLGFLSIFGTLYTFWVIGKVPLLEVFKLTSAWDLAKLRMEVKTDFQGSTYIRQIFGLMLTPIMSYIFFLYYKLYKKKIFLFIFIFFLFLSILILTYNFEKAPVLNYLLGFLFITVLVNGKIPKITLVLMVSFIAGLIVIMYIFIMEKQFYQLFDLYQGGILQRVLISQVVGVFISFEVFPSIEGFVGLSGLSIYSTSFGTEQSEAVSRILMQYANPEGVEAGVAGFMVSLFVSEAWGNFGILGLLISPIYTGFIIQLLYILLLKQKKTPITISLIVFMALYWPITSLFGKFYYNPEIKILLLLFVVVYYGGKFMKRNYGKRSSNNNSNL